MSNAKTSAKSISQEIRLKQQTGSLKHQITGWDATKLDR